MKRDLALCKTWCQVVISSVPAVRPAVLSHITSFGCLAAFKIRACDWFYLSWFSSGSFSALDQSMIRQWSTAELMCRQRQTPFQLDLFPKSHVQICCSKFTVKLRTDDGHAVLAVFLSWGYVKCSCNSNFSLIIFTVWFHMGVNGKGSSLPCLVWLKYTSLVNSSWDTCSFII